jgi:hypothetical protein
VKVCDGPQPQCTRRLTGEFNNDNMLERVITWVPDPVLGDKNEPRSGEHGLARI